MKKTTKKKLVLAKETVMALQENLDRVAGGATTSRDEIATCHTCGACASDFCTDYCNTDYC